MPGERSRDARSDHEILDLLARRYAASLRRYFARRVAAAGDIDDLVQDVFARLARRGDLNDIPEIERYLFRSARNVLADHARRAGARRASLHEPIDEIELAASDCSPERVLINKDQLERIEAALWALPERARDCFVLRDMEEFSVKEIAVGMGITTRAVNYQLANAMAHLAKELERP